MHFFETLLQGKGKLQKRVWAFAAKSKAEFSPLINQWIANLA
jgi:hypothetical protein